MTYEFNGGKKSTTDQRRAIAKLTEDIFAKHIQEARDEEGTLTDEITDDLRKELGVDALDHKIDTLEDQIKLLGKKKETLGWHYGSFDKYSRAGRILEGRVSKRSNSVRDLEKQRKQALTDIWTCDTVEELNDTINDL